jgi:hypothetical protein
VTRLVIGGDEEQLTAFAERFIGPSSG